MAKKCRCYICGTNNADSNHVRSGYIRAGLSRDEHGVVHDAKSKKHSRKVRRLREKRNWKNNQEDI